MGAALSAGQNGAGLRMVYVAIFCFFFSGLSNNLDISTYLNGKDGRTGWRGGGEKGKEEDRKKEHELHQYLWDG